MSKILLIYPFFIPRRDRSVFRFPPLGISYIAASLQKEGHQVTLIDCTFMKKAQALEKALEAQAEVVGIYAMVSMLDESIWFARQLRPSCKLLVAGGPLPTCSPELFMEEFDVVVRGEGEQTLLELLRAFESGGRFTGIDGITYQNNGGPAGEKEIITNPERAFVQDLDSIPFPARSLLPNDAYINYGKKKYGYSITTVMSTRGCPFRCEFCSNVVFGGSYRERSIENVVDEAAEVLALGYDRISFTDDVFTMKKGRVVKICHEIRRRGLNFQWECLGRVDAIDFPTAVEMRAAGCTRIFFGIESGDDEILKLMNKKITTETARRAVQAAHEAGLEVGAFFIIGYPGDTNETVLKTLRFAHSLPIDYLGLSMPYPLPGTDLFRRTQDRIRRDWHPAESPLGGHVLIFDADFSAAKMWFGIIKGHLQHQLKKRPGKAAALAGKLFEKLSDGLFKLMR